MKNEKGFTLIELIISIFITVMLAGMISSFVIKGYRDKKSVVGKKEAIKIMVKDKVKADIGQSTNIVCLEGYKWVIDGTEKYQLGKKDSWGDLKPIECKRKGK